MTNIAPSRSTGSGWLACWNMKADKRLRADVLARRPGSRRSVAADRQIVALQQLVVAVLLGGVLDRRAAQRRTARRRSSTRPGRSSARPRRPAGAGAPAAACSRRASPCRPRCARTIGVCAQPPLELLPHPRQLQHSPAGHSRRRPAPGSPTAFRECGIAGERRGRPAIAVSGVRASADAGEVGEGEREAARLRHHEQDPVAWRGTCRPATPPRA